jgi:hypothetical protein
MGVKFRGVVPPNPQSMRVDSLETVKRDMSANWNSRLAAKETFRLNIWQDEDVTEEDSDNMGISDPEIAKALDKWCRKAARK